MKTFFATIGVLAVLTVLSGFMIGWGFYMGFDTGGKAASGELWDRLTTPEQYDRIPDSWDFTEVVPLAYDQKEVERVRAELRDTEKSLAEQRKLQKEGEVVFDNLMEEMKKTNDLLDATSEQVGQTVGGLTRATE